MNGQAIAASVDPNTSNDVCTFCRHAGRESIDEAPKCSKGHTPYFRSLSNYGEIWVSDCGAGKLRPELAAIDTASVERNK